MAGKSNRVAKIPVQQLFSLLETLVHLGSLLCLFVGTVAAQEDSGEELSFLNLECTPAEALMPLFQLIDSLVQLAFFGGIGLGTLGFMTAGIMLMLPGDDWNRRGKSVAKNTFIGVVILLSAQFIIAFLTNQLAEGVICG